MPTPSLFSRAKSAAAALLDLWPALRHRRNKSKWESNWSNSHYQPPWLGRPVSPEIVDAFQNGWLSRSRPLLDLGCGQGEIVGWCATQGIRAVGVDIAHAAIERARSLFPPSSGPIEFHAIDLCRTPPPNLQYGTLIDRGCFHQIPPADWPLFLQNVLSVSAPDARLILFIRAFREGQPLDDPAEVQRVETLVRQGFTPAFTILRSHKTFIDPHHGQRPGEEMPGIVYWLERQP